MKMIKYLFIGLAVTASGITASGASIMYQGPTDGSGIWETSANWSNGSTTPGTSASDTVVFSGVGGIVSTSAGPAGTAASPRNLEFLGSGWTINGFLTEIQTIHNTGDNAIAIIGTTSSLATSTWTIEKGSTLTILGTSRSGVSYSINIGTNAEKGIVNVLGGGTLVLNTAIFSNTFTSKDIITLTDGNLVINASTLYTNASAPDGVGAYIDIIGADSTFSMKAANVSVVQDLINRNLIHNSTGLEFTLTQVGDYVTYAAVPEPSTIALLGLGAAGLCFCLRRKA